MLRLVVLVLLVVVVWMLLAALLERLRQQGRGAAGTARRGGAAGPAEPLVRCATCGVRVPRSRALPAPGGGAWCSPACRRQAEAGPS
jgi:uncharacterized protein